MAKADDFEFVNSEGQLLNVKKHRLSVYDDIDLLVGFEILTEIKHLIIEYQKKVWKMLKELGGKNGM